MSPETFIELVPRCAASLQSSMEELERSETPFDGYNIPELVGSGRSFLRPEDLMQLRSDGRISVQKKLALHLRTRERTVEETSERISLVARHGVNIALLVTGDPVPPIVDRCTHAHDVISSSPLQKPPMHIAVAADIYRPDWGRWNQKVSAIGKTVDAVFTQPIFDGDTLEEVGRRTHHLLRPDSVFAGITWITTDRGRRYWHEQNGVPENHLPGGTSDADITRNSIGQAADVLRAIRQQGYSTYIMPMRGTLLQLQRILSLSENVREV